MGFKAQWYRDRLAKRRQKGFRGYPVATLAFYGPDDKRASKVAVGIVRTEEGELARLERWYTDTTDARNDPEISEAIVRFLDDEGAKSVVATDRIIGCPHEEGIDYPEGEPCPKCPYWAHRDRWSDESAPSIAVCWYTPDEWALVKAVAADPEVFENSFQEWEAMAADALRDLRNAGATPYKVLVFADELQAWCLAHGKPLRADARAEFVAEKARAGAGAET